MSALSALKSLTNSGTMGGSTGPTTSGAIYGGGTSVGGLTFGNQGMSGWWLIAAVLLALAGYWLVNWVGG
ncbi:hypothetical protein [Celerinatantimonas sp. MCCC 1A17872]|uniref:hypothetical protein n=1 Tax=Celerinatantimonas sp. MCCC 1A17872 TaxID=3177514 RepID=UPI0038CAB1F6